MNCRYCSTELPEGALFCGECGRAVQPRTTVTPPVSVVPDRVDARGSSDPEAQEDPVPAVEPDGVARLAPDPEVITESEPQPAAVPGPALEFAPEPEPEPPFAPAPDGDLAPGPPAPDAESHQAIEPPGAPPTQSTPVVPAAVPPQPAPVAPAVSPTQPTTVAPPTQPTPVAPAGEEHCTQCGATLASSDIFCGECGFVRQSVARRHASDTNVLDPFPWGLPREPQRPTAPPTTPEPAPVYPTVPAPEPPPVPAPEPPPVPAPEPAPHGDPLAPPPLVSPAPSGAPEPLPDLGDVDETRLVDRTARGERFVLQFSTGESVSVFGTGLIGRNPIPEPGEYFDAIVAIIDPGKSVSKTHLEFGQEGGAFWINDRFSGNGTVVREPERAPRRVDPGKRYRLVRGSRVDIGEQFFIVS